MKKIAFLSALLVVSGAYAQTAAFTAGRLVLATSYNNAGFAPNTACPVTLLEYPATIGATQTYALTLPSTAATPRFTNSASASSNLNLQFNGTKLILAGYDAEANSVGVATSSAASAPRVIAIIPVSGAVSYLTSADAFSGNNFRSAYSDGTNAWGAGTASSSANAGIRYFPTTGTSIPVQGASPAPTNTRVVTAFGGNLYFSNSTAVSTGASGIYRITGMPIVSSTSTTLSSLVMPVPAVTVGTTTTGPSAYDFVFTNATTCYVADDRSAATGGGLYKFTSSDGGATWTQAYLIQATLPTGIRGVTFLGNGGGSNELAVVTNESVSGSGSTTAISTVNQVWKITDGGTAALSTSVKLFDCPTNAYTRGIRYIPASNQALTGSLNLANTGAFAFNRSIGYSVTQGTSTIGSGTITASASATSFNISLSASYTGAATIVWDGSSFLKRKTNINLTGSNLAVGSVTMQNGDVDNSGEVDAADIDAVIANFGSMSDITSDVDVSGEVDAADIDIVIANFGGTDD